MASIDEVFREVESEAAHYGVVPVENSTEGMVNHTLDCFMDSPVLHLRRGGAAHPPRTCW
jgi:chorismate mutase / prephenate dehydratase